MACGTAGSFEERARILEAFFVVSSFAFEEITFDNGGGGFRSSIGLFPSAEYDGGLFLEVCLFLPEEE